MPIRTTQCNHRTRAPGKESGRNRRVRDGGSKQSSSQFLYSSMYNRPNLRFDVSQALPLQCFHREGVKGKTPCFDRQDSVFLAIDGLKR